jgi:8-oxo-dGTP pyrophosphatase MutT (NUDIX family)
MESINNNINTAISNYGPVPSSFSGSSSSSSSGIFSKTSINYCNNCGLTGHIFSNCKYPITSVGIIAFRYNTNNNIEYLMIRRKDTIGYIEFMRGKYSINNKLYLLNLISEMSLIEKEKILKNDFDTLWYELWGLVMFNQFKSEEKNARDKFDTLKIGINCGTTNFNLQTLVDESDTQWTEPEWGFPKGRHNNLEKDLPCGLREFDEETGYPAFCVNILYNILPYEEIFTGSNYKSYKHKYYVGYIDKDQQPKKRFQESEISKLEWCSYEDSVKKIRPYNLEKLKVLHNVDKLLNKYNIYNIN